jgi:hypothetical protein
LLGLFEGYDVVYAHVKDVQNDRASLFTVFDLEGLLTSIIVVVAQKSQAERDFPVVAA